ncbi:MAG TPA: GtrA family protein [Daejeonella sp.]|nr:GtrA family protein [Daejeonella sp.]
MSLSADFFLKFFKFGLVGFSGIFVDFSITYLCKEKFKIHKYVANSLGFTVATGTNYLLNRYWTFNTGEGPHFVQFGKFFGIALVGLLLNNLLIYFFNDKLKLNFYLSKAIAIAIVSLWNFMGNYLYTFAV